MKRITSLVIFALLACSVHAQLAINEMSNGPSGSKEWVEFVVVGTPGCTAQCVDLRGWIIDDNNGTFATGGGQGIADGHMRFPNIPEWSCVPIGTIIVVYNVADRDALIPADDTTGASCVYILPSNTYLLEHSNTSPTAAGVTSYGGPYLANGDWNTSLLNNSSDSYQTRDPANTTVPYSAVSYGGNSNNNIIYFAGAGTGLTFFMNNATNNNPLLQANWASGPASAATPGAPNNAANATWIHTMNNNCQPIVQPSVTAFHDTTICDGQTVMLWATANGAGTFSWSTGQTTDTIFVTPNDTTTYRVIYTNGTGCSDTAFATVTVLPGISVFVTTTNAMCGIANGTAIAHASGGSGYTYQWNTNPVQTNDTIINLGTGTYIVNVTASNGCSARDTGAVIQILGDSVRIISSQAPRCAGDSNAMAVAQGFNGTGPYTYVWNTSPAQTTDSAVGLHGNFTYIVTVTDANGCTATTGIRFVDPSPLTGTVTHTDVTCAGLNNGTATVHATGGTPTYTYQWNTSPAQTLDSAINLTAGSYAVTVRDSHGCSTVDSVIILAPPVLSLIDSLIDSTHCGFNNGSMTANAFGGTPPYSYRWNTAPPQTTQTATNVAAGSYNVTVTDAHGCTASASTIIVGGSTPLSANITGHNTSCGGAADGSAYVTVNNGTPVYTYIWSTNPAQTTDSIGNVPAGNYAVTVTDGAGCKDTLNVTIAGPPLDSFTATPTGNRCFGDSTGSIVLASTATLTYSFNGSPFTGTTTYNNLPAGTYTIIGRNSSGCTTTEVATVSGASATVNVVITPDSANIVRGDQVVLDASASGGTAPYAYNWAPSTGLSCTNCASTTATPNDTTIYVVTATDVNGCPDTAEVRISVRNPFIINFPSGFTPDGDGNNDLFRAITNGPVDEFDLKIWNRWGELVFETNSIKHGWDGKYKGSPQNIETFVWLCQYKQVGQGKFELAKGNITIVK